MDKYEYNLKLDQIKSLSSEENYVGAAEIADTINWNKIKNINTLVKAGEIYEKAERYDDARDILLMAYDRSPIGRMIIYRLAEVAIKMGDYDAATEYYDEFVEIAPHDDLRYVLKYSIKKGQGASYDELIEILEEFKEQEYTEEWAYELAYLYHKAGKTEKCIEACDELILWFGDGPYVERALELKMLYQPLTKDQEEKYRKFRFEHEGKTQIDAAEMTKAGERWDFVTDILIRYKNMKQIYGYKMKEYWSNIATVESYYQTNMDFLKPEVRKYFFHDEPKIYSKVDDLPPAKYNIGSDVRNSLIASGCIVNSKVENSILFKKVFVGKNCVIKNSIILNDVYIGDNTHIENCIVESRDTLKANTYYCGDNGIKIVSENNERYVL